MKRMTMKAQINNPMMGRGCGSELSWGWGCVVCRVVIGECDVNGPGGVITLGQMVLGLLWGCGIYREQLHVLLMNQLNKVPITIPVVHRDVMTTNLFPVKILNSKILTVLKPPITFR